MEKLITTQDKIDMFKDYNMSRHERKMAAAYLWALYRNKEDVIAEFERFGDRPRAILMNKYAYECGLKFGFDSMLFDEYGWLVRAKFEQVEVLEFPHKKGFAIHNKVEVGCGPNGKWVYGVWYSYGSGGGVSGMSVYDEIFNSKNEAIVAGLNDLIRRLTKEPDAMPAIINQAKDMLDKLTGKKEEQMNLFEML